MKRRPARANIIALLFETFMAILPFAQPPLKVVEVVLQVADKELRLAGRGYDCRVIRVKG